MPGAVNTVVNKSIMDPLLIELMVQLADHWALLEDRTTGNNGSLSWKTNPAMTRLDSAGPLANSLFPHEALMAEHRH